MKSCFSVQLMLYSLSFIFGCSSINTSSDYEKIADKITEKTAKELKVQKNLCLVGTGGQMMHDIQMMEMSFFYYQEVDLKTARELIIYAIDKYLSAINSNIEIRPYLHEYPFTAKNAEINIWVFEPNGSNPPFDKIHYISAINGILSYYLDRPEPHLRDCIRKETYEEALKEMAVNQGSQEEVCQTTNRECSEKSTIIEAVTKDGAKVDIEVTSHEHSMFQLSGRGFKPYESLNFISNSYSEVIHGQVQADKDGNLLPMVLLPAVIGKSGGICHIDILREEGSIHIKLPWGLEP